MNNDRAILFCIVTLIFGVAIGIAVNGGVTQVTSNFYHFEAYWKHTEGLTLSYDVQNYYYTLMYNTSTQNNGFVFESDNENITVNNTGVYQILFSAVGSGQNNHEYVLSVAINGICKEQASVKQKLSAGRDETTMNGQVILSLTAGDKITIKTKDASGTGDGEYYHANINIVWIDFT